MTRPKHSIAFDSPGIYRIRVQGRVAPERADALAGMHIKVGSASASSHVTTLVGELVDQSQLAGVLDALVNLRFPLLSVERLSGASAQTSA